MEIKAKCFFINTNISVCIYQCLGNYILTCGCQSENNELDFSAFWLLEATMRLFGLPGGSEKEFRLMGGIVKVN